MEHVAPGTRAKQRLLQQSCYSSQTQAALSEIGAAIFQRVGSKQLLAQARPLLGLTGENLQPQHLKNYNGNSFGIEEAVAKASKAKGPNAIVTHFRKIEGKCVERYTVQARVSIVAVAKIDSAATS